MNTEQLIELANNIREMCQYGASESDIVQELQRLIELETPRIRKEVLQDAAVLVVNNAAIKNRCCADTRASAYMLIRGMGDDV